MTAGFTYINLFFKNNVVHANVFYVAEEGSDTNSGRQISRAFASIRYATDYVSANVSPSATNPITIYVKSGVYEEVLPIHVPNYVTVVGDNIRNTVAAVFYCWKTYKSSFYGLRLLKNFNCNFSDNTK